jgi:hypothetical protein
VVKTAQDAAGAASAQKKRVISAKSLANLRPNSQNLTHVGGSKAREYATNQEIELLQNLLDGATHRDAARRAGVSQGINVTSLLRRSVIAKEFQEMQARRLSESMEASKRRREELSQFLYPEIMHAIRNAKTHSRTGDLGKAKLFEVAGRMSGDIQSTNFKASATASATVQAGVAEIDIYKPLWLRESEAQMLAEARKRILGPDTPPEAGNGRKITAVKATEYVIAAKGDKDFYEQAYRDCRLIYDRLPSPRQMQTLVQV